MTKLREEAVEAVRNALIDWHGDGEKIARSGNYVVNALTKAGFEITKGDININSVTPKELDKIIENAAFICKGIDERDDKVTKVSTAVLNSEVSEELIAQYVEDIVAKDYLAIEAAVADVLAARAYKWLEKNEHSGATEASRKKAAEDLLVALFSEDKN